MTDFSDSYDPMRDPSSDAYKFAQSKLALVKSEAQLINDLRTLDSHVRTLPGGSYWYSNEDTCGIYNGFDAAATDEDGAPRSWHRHARGEGAARHVAAEHIRKLCPRCNVREVTESDATMCTWCGI